LFLRVSTPSPPPFLPPFFFLLRELWGRDSPKTVFPLPSPFSKTPYPGQIEVDSSFLACSLWAFSFLPSRDGSCARSIIPGFFMGDHYLVPSVFFSPPLFFPESPEDRTPISVFSAPWCGLSYPTSLPQSTPLLPGFAKTSSPSPLFVFQQSDFHGSFDGSPLIPY